jgi:Glycosyl transferase family 2.
MIPTYDPRADYLDETLNSVLRQDPGPDQMQIEVVDDCSPHRAPVELVRWIAGDRVQFIANQRTMVWPASGIVALSEHSDAGAIFCRHAVANSKERSIFVLV